MSTDDPSKSFILIHGDWPASRALAVIDRAAQVKVVVARRPATAASPAEHRAIPRLTAERALKKIPADGSTWDALAAVGDAKLRAVMGPCGLVGVMSTRVNRGTPMGFAPAADPARAGDAPTGTSGPSRRLIGVLPPKAAVDQEILLKVHLAERAGAAGPADFDAPPGSVVDVLVDIGGCLSAIDPTAGKLIVSSPQNDAALLVRLKGTAEGEGSVTISAYHQGLGVARLVLAVVVGGTNIRSKPIASEAKVHVHQVRQPDLAMEVSEAKDGSLVYRLSSADGKLYLMSFGPISLGDPLVYFRNLFADIERLPMATEKERASAEAHLTAKGANLYEQLLPAELRDLLWKERDRIKSVQITSVEPWIPWELCRLTGKDGARKVGGPFFAEQFAMSRWLVGVPLTQRLALREIAVVVPTQSKLPSAPKELEHLRSLAGPSRNVTRIDPTFVSVTAEMAKGVYDAWHFTGHARADKTGDADQASIELDERDRLTPADISGETENVLVPRPLVFLNACQSAQAGMSLTGPGGWARRFLRPDLEGPGASAFIGTHWSVGDGPAFEFAKKLYFELLAGTTIAEAVRQARLAIRTANDPAWLAYSVYAHPYAALTAEGA